METPLHFPRGVQKRTSPENRGPGATPKEDHFVGDGSRINTSKTTSLIEPALGHNLCLPIVLLLSETLDVVKQHLSVGR